MTRKQQQQQLSPDVILTRSYVSSIQDNIDVMSAQDSIHQKYYDVRQTSKQQG